MKSIKRIKRGIAAAVAALAVALPASAIDLPVTTVNGKDYYYYDVQPNETLFSLSQRLGISRDEIISYNPGVDGGLKAYTRLYFPTDAGVSTISAGDHITTSHEVKKGETLYGIAKKYGISVDRLIALNPSARDGVKTGETLVIVQDDTHKQPTLPTATGNGGTHTIAAGETLYRIARNNGVTVEQLLAANPSLDAYNYSEGTVINIPAAASAPSAADVTEVDVNLQPVNAPSADITEVDVNLQPVNNHSGNTEYAANTESKKTEKTEAASKPTAKETPAEPQPAASDKTVVANNTALPQAEFNVEKRNEQAAAAEQRDENAPFNIAVMLPFNLNEETAGKEAENFTEFYRGFLLAAKEQNKSGHKVNIHAYDTRGDLDTVKELMAQTEMADMDIFVTPASAAEIDYIISQVDADRQFVFNNFAVRNNAYLTNPNVIQANIPHTKMYQRAIDAFLNDMNGRMPIFIQRIGATADKEEFTSMLKTQLTDNGIAFKEITYENSLKDDDFADLSKDESYVIIPLSSSSNEFSKIVPAAKRFKDSLASAGGLCIFGYPEWLTFRGDRRDNLGTLNATIYSRFYLDENYYPVRRLAENYKREYGREMNSAVPSQAFMGYDVATYIIKALRNNNGDFHINLTPFDGMQSDFIFSDSDCEGIVNTAVELIKFSEGGFTEHRNI